jgi:hypothetical protein
LLQIVIESWGESGMAKHLANYKFVPAICAFSILGGCGTYVPGIQEPGESSAQGELQVQELVKHIHCEVERAVKYVYDFDNKYAATNGVRLSKFLDTWGAQITLNLTIEESSALAPGVSFKTPILPANVSFPGKGNVATFPQSYGLGLGGTISSDATRIDKLSTYYTVKELLKEPTFCEPGDPSSYLLLNGDLKVKEWLVDTVFLQGTEAANFAGKEISDQYKQSVISHEVKFIVVSNGNITPSWNLVRVSANPSGSFFSAGRTRTHDLTVTFGPNESSTVATQPSPKSKKQTQVANSPSQTAVNAHLASEIGLAVANSLQSLQQP